MDGSSTAVHNTFNPFCEVKRMAEFKELGKKIRELRSENNMTQQQLGEKIGVGTTHISHMETGNTLPSMKTFLRIVDTFDCSADELLGIHK
mgnify:FL=1